jgi:hypothetical protein
MLDAARATIALAGPALAAALAVGTPAAAQDCPGTAEDAYAMGDDEITALYACIEAAMAEGYAGGDDPVAAAYRGWTVTGTRPGPDPSHGDRLLLTFANEAAADTYLGAILAKESIAIRGGAGRVGPLFIMEKLGAEAAPDTGGWRYSGIQPNGAPMDVPQAFCHDCHAAFDGQDSLAYPASDLRVGQ